MRIRRGVFAILLALALAAPVQAVEPDEVLADPALEARARALSLELRCLVCQNQSIDDSNAPLARDLRLLVRERLKTGESDTEVRAFLVQRYGEFVLLKPPFNWSTIGLWLTPLLVLCAAIFLFAKQMRQAPVRDTKDANLNADEEAALARALEGQSGRGRADG